MTSWPAFSKPNVRAIAYVMLASIAALGLSTLLHVPHGPEHWSADLRTAYFSGQRESQHDRLALVYVTEKSLERFPYTSPTDRGLLADLVKALDAAGPKVIGLDFIFDRPTEPAKDAALTAAIKGASTKIVLGSLGTGTAPAEEGSFEARLRKETGRPAGHLYFGEHHNPLVISDSVVRTTYHGPGAGSGSFAEEIVQASGLPAKPLSHYISWLKPPVDGSETFLTLSAEAVLASPGSDTALPLRDLLKDRIVIVGGNFFDRDQHLIPFSVRTEERYPGASIHAQIIAQMLDGRALNVPGILWRFLLLIAAAGIGYWAGTRSGSRYLFLELATVVGLILIGLLLFRYFDMIFPYTGTFLAWLAGAAGGHYGRPGHH